MSTANSTTVPSTLPSTVHMLDIVFGTTGVLGCTTGLVMNAMCIRYFYQRSRYLSNLIFLTMTIIDILTCVTTLPNSVSKLYNRAPMWFSSDLICNASSLVWFVTSRLSVFLVGVQSVLRTIALFFPFRKINRKLVLGIIGGYMGVQAGFGMMPYYFGELRFYVSSSSMCLFDPMILLWPDNNRAAHAQLYTLLIILPLQYIPFLAPAIPIIASCILTIIVLKRSEDLNACKKRRERKDKATTTVLLITVIYIFFNILYWGELSVAMFDWNGGVYISYSRFDRYYLLRNISMPMSVLLNAACNPLVYFTRIEELSLLLTRRVTRVTKASVTQGEQGNTLEL